MPEEAEDEYKEPVVEVEVTKIDVHPDKCEITSELKLEIEFSVDISLDHAVWEIKVDLLLTASDDLYLSLSLPLTDPC